MRNLALLLLLLVACQLAFPDVAAGGFTFGRHQNFDFAWQRLGVMIGDFHNMYNLHIVYEPEDTEWPFKGWFFGWAAADCNPGFPGCDAIYAARSKSLTGSWQVWTGADWDATGNCELWAPVIAPENEPWDSVHYGDPTVIKHQGQYLMAYSSVGQNADGKPWLGEGDTDGSLLCIRGAVSKDGINWTKSEQPILLHKEDFGAPIVPQGDSHPEGSYQRPSLMWDEGKLKLWFDYWLPGHGVCMGYAENEGDFLSPKDWRIIRAGKQPAMYGAPNPDVVKIGDLYVCYSDGGGYADPLADASQNWSTRKITEAVSLDGIDFLPVGYVNSDPAAPATHVPEALVMTERGRPVLYVDYGMQKGGQPYDWRYGAIGLMRRPVTETLLSAWRQAWQAVPGEGQW